MAERLGFTQYVTQGGDWGYEISRAISFLYPESCKANHLNFDGGFPKEFLQNPPGYFRSHRTEYTAGEQAGLEHTCEFRPWHRLRHRTIHQASHARVRAGKLAHRAAGVDIQGFLIRDN